MFTVMVPKPLRFRPRQTRNKWSGILPGIRDHDYLIRSVKMNRNLRSNTFGFIFSFTFYFTGNDSKVSLLC